MPPLSSRNDGPPTRAPGRPSWRLLVSTPGRAFLAVTLAVFLSELALMWALQATFSPRVALGALVDAAALMAIMASLLYLLFVRPMARIDREKVRAGQSLLRAHRDLDRQVRERTAELEAANRRLRDEAGEVERANARIRFQASLLDAVDQAVTATDAEGRVRYWNRFAESLFGWNAQGAQGRKLWEVAPFEAEGTDDVSCECDTDHGWTGEVRAGRRNGSRFPAYLTCSPIRDQGGSRSGFVYAFLDLTDRKEAEEALRYSEEKYSTLVEDAPTGIFIYRDQKVVFANQRYLEMVGRSREEINAFDAADTVHPDDRSAVEETWRKRCSGEPTPQEFEYRIVTPGGQIRWVSARSAVIRYREGLSLLGNIQDVTERRSAEYALEESRETLRHLSARLVTAQEDERRRVARDLHDSLGQSLSAIKFVVERALDGAWPNERRQQLVALQTVVPTIQASVDEVRRISMALRPSTLDDLGLLATIAWFAREFQSTYPHIRVERSIEVEESQIPESLKTVIFRILQEALNNVAKHSGAGRVEVALSPTEEGLELVVADDGEGFEPDLARKKDAPGGFGLAFMRERAELLGGVLSVRSATGRGTRVTARWPLNETVTA